IGALILMLVSPALLLMVVSILGIPLVPLAIMLFCVCVLMGLAAFSRILSGRFYGALDKRSPGTLGAVTVGYLLLTGLLILGNLMKVAGHLGGILGGILILANLMILCGAVVAGLGAVWTTRMGGRGEEKL
ncbi:MAG: hypothetical protein PHF00_05130, partial [Elusimicrobia bacterium]|nr:hypothetical protein [Elusimicrobiota bacterium]